MFFMKFNKTLVLDEKRDSLCVPIIERYETLDDLAHFSRLTYILYSSSGNDTPGERKPWGSTILLMSFAMEK